MNYHAYFSAIEFRSSDQIYFQTLPRYMVYKNALFGRTFEHQN